MARPVKTKIDYFPIDCTEDDRMKLVELKHGLVAYAVYIKLLQKIYGNKGYYIDWNEDRILLFSGEYGIAFETVTYIVADMVTRGIFNKEIYEKYSVLTSKDIQEQYFFVISKRKVKCIDERLRLINIPKTGVSAEKTEVSDEKTGVSADNNPHSIGEYSKVKDSIAKESIGEAETRHCCNRDLSLSSSDPEEVNNTPTPPPKSTYGEFNNVILTEVEYEKLSKRFNNIDSSIERLSRYMAATGKGYASHYAVLMKWAEEDRSQPDNNLSLQKQKKDEEFEAFFEAALRRSEALLSE